MQHPQQTRINIFNKQLNAGRQATNDAGRHMPTVPPPVKGPNVKATAAPHNVNATDGTPKIVAPSGQKIQSVSNVGDVNDDGTQDFAVVTESAAYVVFGTGSPSDVHLATLGPHDGVTFDQGSAVAPAGDYDANGTDDLVVTDDQGIHVIAGTSGTIDTTTPLFDVPDGGSVPVTGKVSKAGDLNNDGADDLAVADGNSNVTIYFGNGAGTVDLAGSDPRFGEAVASVSDLNGDNADDLVIGSPAEDTVYVILSGIPSSTTTLDPQNLGTDGYKITGAS